MSEIQLENKSTFVPPYPLIQYLQFTMAQKRIALLFMYTADQVSVEIISILRSFIGSFTALSHFPLFLCQIFVSVFGMAFFLQQQYKACCHLECGTL
jgi:hypothetical protein